MEAAAVPTSAAVVVATYDNILKVRATVRSAREAGRLPSLVIDVDGTYSPVSDERVISFVEAVKRLGLSDEASMAAATLEPEELSFYAGVVGASYAQSAGSSDLVVLGAGVLVLDDLRSTASGNATVVPGTDATSVILRTAAAPVHLRPDPHTGILTSAGPGAGALFNRALYAVRSSDHIAVLRGLAADWRVTSVALDAFAVAVDATVNSSPSLLISPWRAVSPTSLGADDRLYVDGTPVQAVDLTEFDAHRPWVLDARGIANPRVLLSQQPALARITEEEARDRLADESVLVNLRDSGEIRKPDRVRMDAVLRSEARRERRVGVMLPDLLGLGAGTSLERWALGLVPDGDPMPLARYLAAARLARPDLQHAFPQVPGSDAVRLAKWALEWGINERPLDSDLLARAAQATLEARARVTTAARGRRPQGVNLVGYLAGELGLGESARLVDNALRAAGVETSTYDVSRDLGSRRGAEYRRSDPVMHDTSLLCVNGAETAAVAPQLSPLLKRTRVIGMWYWELEDFPKAHQAGFAYVDEVWTATDFMRDAIAKHAGHIPVRTVTPPLPQAGDDPGEVPERFGIPTDRPWFLFTFDFLSLATRKNPYGLVDAFTKAFGERPVDARPLLVIKTINADAYPAHAERLRFQIAGRPDVMLLDTYLDHHERHVLVSHCTAYVSLHKAEGLGLTVAEAMAWGKPVIVTGYGGVMQFCNERNSFLVSWERGYIEEAAGPYEKGLPWAEPNLDHAADFMRIVIDEPERAAAVGEQAAEDIRQLHNADVAGAKMRHALEEGRAQWRAAKAADRARRQAGRGGGLTDDSGARTPNSTDAFQGIVRHPGETGRAKLRRYLQSARSRRVRS